ncbi:polyprenyl synthetase family protein [Helicobacter saguini]|uniref:Polyprenyl synthetase family protein n=2 Tax=Helicobacter saguini TaxID=1548018 RepID=A0A347VMK7_9HELI|nr:polyprenyl synthetase family protein [Helicobacter saguini]MWV68163.1 polyprenyl synthetase family protein [Helicobacter saguini]MWV70374.1 polyprenyl synthetase family protein [Helicobacter saguini]MWV72275.1 polyprenyl synthetase family protein [Helicobacter saguini]TLD95365.1 polyprenyl synthetase family protein [Helicobacter saguini]
MKNPKIDSKDSKNANKDSKKNIESSKKNPAQKQNIESTTTFFTQSCLAFEEFLKNNKPTIQSFHPHFEDAFWEMVLVGGKRFRPNLLLSVVCAFAPQLRQNAYIPALAIECLHTYSLIHDDLPCMDNADLRRGSATLHKKYDETSAVLVGDGLNTYAFFLLSNAKFSAQTRINLVQILSQNGGISGMILGQSLDCAFENVRLTRTQVDFIHTQKTAKLIAASLKMGAVIANLSREMCELLYTFGLKLGLFFQIRDDIIDFTQDSKKSGKTSQNDAAKNSYVNLLGLSRAIKIKDEYATSLQNDLQSFDDSIESKNLKANLELLLSAYFKE